MDTVQCAHPFDQLLAIDARGRRRAALSGSSANGPAAGAAGNLALRLDGWNLLFSLDEASEIIPVPRITRVPGVKAWLLGIANLRGTVVTVVDLHAFLYAKPSVQTPSSRVVVVRDGDWSYGLLVDEIIGMRHFEADCKLPDLDAVDASLRRFISDGFRGDGRQWLAFDTSRLLNDPSFLGAAD